MGYSGHRPWALLGVDQTSATLGSMQNNNVVAFSTCWPSHSTVMLLWSLPLGRFPFGFASWKVKKTYYYYCMIPYSCNDILVLELMITAKSFLTSPRGGDPTKHASHVNNSTVFSSANLTNTTSILWLLMNLFRHSASNGGVLPLHDGYGKSERRL